MDDSFDLYEDLNTNAQRSESNEQEDNLYGDLPSNTIEHKVINLLQSNLFIHQKETRSPHRESTPEESYTRSQQHVQVNTYPTSSSNNPSGKILIIQN